MRGLYICHLGGGGIPWRNGKPVEQQYCCKQVRTLGERLRPLSDKYREKGMSLSAMSQIAPLLFYKDGFGTE